MDHQKNSNIAGAGGTRNTPGCKNSTHYKSPMNDTNKNKGKSASSLSSINILTKRKATAIDPTTKSEKLFKKTKTNTQYDVDKELKQMRAQYGPTSNRSRVTAYKTNVKVDSRLRPPKPIILPTDVETAGTSKFTPNSESSEETIWTIPRKTSKSPNQKLEIQKDALNIKNRYAILQETAPIQKVPAAEKTVEDSTEGDSQASQQVNKPIIPSNTSIEVTMDADHYHHTPMQHTPEPISQPAATQRTDEQTTSPPRRPRKAHRPSPIHVRGSSLNEIANLITSNIPEAKNNFYVSNSREKKFINIMINNLPLYNNVKDFLSKQKTEYYTYTPKESKLKSLVLKNLYGEFNNEEIEDEIKSLNIKDIEIIKITNITLGKADKKINTHLVQITSNSIEKQLTSIKFLFNQKIKWEPLYRNGPFQCTRCQRFGHSRSNCALDFRCVKCSLSHTPGNCDINKNSPLELLKCANCNESGHPANYRGCRIYKEAIAEIKQNISNRNEAINAKARPLLPTQVNATSPINNNYANITKRGRQTLPPYRPDIPEIYTQRPNEIPNVINEQHNNNNRDHESQTPPPWADSLLKSMVDIFTPRFKNIDDKIEDIYNKIENHAKYIVQIMEACNINNED